MYQYGIDLSHWNGAVDFAKVKTNYAFAILKVSQKTSKDVKFDEYYLNAKKTGLPIGVYIYNKVTNVVDAEKEANFAVKCLNGKSLECGVWLDMEDATMKSLGKSRLTEIINAEAKILQAAGFKVGVYCNKSWYKSVLDGANLEKTYPFWIAGYPSDDNGTIKESLRPSYGIIWQYSSKGTVSGIRGNVDMNESKVNLVEYMSGKVAEAPTSAKVVVGEYSLANFVSDARKCLGVSETATAEQMLAKTVTISASSNRNNALVTPLERYLKALGYYKGSIEADSGKKPCFGAKMKEATRNFQHDVVGLSYKFANQGEYTAKGTTYKWLFGCK